MLLRQAPGRKLLSQGRRPIQKLKLVGPLRGLLCHAFTIFLELCCSTLNSPCV
jgi:hypothetical protein